MAVICLIIFLMGCGSTAVYADDRKAGSIHIYMEEEGAVFYVTKVADKINGEYTMMESFNQAQIDLNVVRSAEELEKSIDILENIYMNPDYTLVIDERGEAQIKQLAAGVYLVQGETRNKEIVSSLAEIPAEGRDGEEEYDISLYPKYRSVELEISAKTGDASAFGIFGLFLLVATILAGVSLLYLYRCTFLSEKNKR